MLRPKRTSGNCGVAFLFLFLMLMAYIAITEYSEREKVKRRQIERARAEQARINAAKVAKAREERAKANSAKKINPANNTKPKKTSKPINKPPKQSIKSLGTNHFWIHKSFFSEHDWPFNVDHCEIKLVDTWKYIVAVKVGGEVFGLSKHAEGKFRMITQDNKYLKSRNKYLTLHLFGFAVDKCNEYNDLIRAGRK